MNEAFALAHEFTAQWEGGLSNHPQDVGGITQYGVSYAWLMQLEEENRVELVKIAQTADGCNAWTIMKVRTISTVMAWLMGEIL